MDDDDLVLNLAFEAPVRAQKPFDRRHNAGNDAADVHSGHAGARAGRQHENQQQQVTNSSQHQHQATGRSFTPASDQQRPKPKGTSQTRPADTATQHILNQVLASAEDVTRQRNSSGHASSDGNKQQQEKQHQPSQQQQQSQHHKQRDKHVPGKKRKYADVAAPDDDIIAGADSDEDEHVGAAVALALGREQQLQQEVAHAGLRPAGDDSDDDSDFIAQAKRSALDLPNVVHMDDEDGGAPAYPTPSSPRRKKQRARQQASQAPKPKPAVQHKSGELAHAATNISASTRQEYFGSGSSSAAADSFAALGVSPALAEHLESLDFKVPTRVQQLAIPVLLRGRDALVRAPTGSGKTLSYVVPIVNDLQGQTPRISRSEGTYAVVVVPTRELALQVADVLAAVVRRFHFLVPGMLIGGENRNHEKQRLRKGLSVLVATPGRLLDHLQQTSSFRVSELRWFVLDEADRLLDMGFEQKIASIVDIVRQRQASSGGGAPPWRMALLSATLHSKLGNLANLGMKDPEAIGFTLRKVDGKLQIASSAGEGAAAAAGGGGQGASAEPAKAIFEMPKQLKQSWVEVPTKLRTMALAAALRSVTRRGRPAKVVVFMSSCDGVEYHHALLGGCFEQAAGEKLLACPLLKLHGDMVQAERTATFLQFSQAQSGVLLCTDVAARGLDFPSVTNILQYDPPGEAAEYVHRVGRTARIGQQGAALLFLQPAEKVYATMLQQHGIQLAEEKADSLLSWLPQLEQGLGGGRAREKDKLVAAALLHRKVMAVVEKDKALKQLASDAFRSYVRAYASVPTAVKSIFAMRRLHTGHVAHSFGLAETPTMLGSSGSSAERKKRKLQQASSALRHRKKAVNKHAQQLLE